MPAPPPDEYKEVAGWKIAEPGDDKIWANWWEMYRDPKLNQLEEQVQISNQTIAVYASAAMLFLTLCHKSTV